MYACTYVWMPKCLILKGISNMPANKAAARVIMEDNFTDVPELGNKVTQFFLYNTDG